MATLKVELTPKGEQAIALLLPEDGPSEESVEAKLARLVERFLGTGTVRSVVLVMEPFPYVPTDVGEQAIFTGTRQFGRQTGDHTL